MLEGEGSFQFLDRMITVGGKAYPCRELKILCTMTDRDVLVRLKKWSGVGKVYATRRHETNPALKPQFVWAVQKSQHAYALMVAIFPFMSERRRGQIKVACQAWIAAPVRPRKGAKERCVNNHPYTPENTYTNPSGVKFCRTCRRESRRRYQE